MSAGLEVMTAQRHERREAHRGAAAASAGAISIGGGLVVTSALWGLITVTLATVMTILLILIAATMLVCLGGVIEWRLNTDYRHRWHAAVDLIKQLETPETERVLGGHGMLSEHSELERRLYPEDAKHAMNPMMPDVPPGQSVVVLPEGAEYHSTDDTIERLTRLEHFAETEFPRAWAKAEPYQGWGLPPPDEPPPPRFVQIPQ